MKLHVVLAIAAILLAAPAASAVSSSSSDVATTDSPCSGVVAMGVVPWTICMVEYGAGAAGNAIVLACQIIFGPDGC